MLVERSMLTMRIERSFCPLRVLVEEACLQCISREASVRLQCLSTKHAYNAYRKKHLSAYKLVERSMLTVRIERSICPLTMLVERSMLTMRIERSICPLTMLVERSMRVV